MHCENKHWKVTLIPHTNVTHGIDDSNEIGHAWMVWSQQHLNMTYKVPLPFTKYVCCTCEWALHGNLCKHHIVVTCTDFIKENIIQYCGTWCGSNCGGFVAMFVKPTYLHIYDNEFDDEEVNEDHFEEPWVVKMCELMRLDDTSPNVEKREGSQPTFKFIHPYGKSVCSNGWHDARNHQWIQRRWGSTHRPHHIIVACYWNKCTRYLPFQGK